MSPKEKQTGDPSLTEKWPRTKIFTFCQTNRSSAHVSKTGCQVLNISYLYRLNVHNNELILLFSIMRNTVTVAQDANAN